MISVFGRTMKGRCLAANADTSESVCIRAPHDLEVYLTEGATERKDTFGLSRYITIPEDGELQFIVPKQDPPKAHAPATPPLFAERSITGHGQERGGVRALLVNPSPDETVEFVYFETLPWFMKPYLHTLSARISPIPTANSSSAREKPAAESADLIKDMYYRPGLDRVRGSQLELHVTIPPSTTMTLTYDFDKAILRYTEYPPDANRGRDVAPAIIRLLSGSGLEKGSKASYLRTTPLMLPLPTPDFSMPYNVIILTSTVIALAFGMVYNMLVRRFVAMDEGEEQGARAAILAVIRKIRAAILKVRVRSNNEAAEKKHQ